MKTLHIDTGREMRGGQWQVLYLVERLRQARLMARSGSPLALHARERGIDSGSLFDTVDLFHAHDARAHALAILANRKPLIVSRRVGFPIRATALSQQKYMRAAMYIAVSGFVALRLQDAGVPAEKIRVVYDGVPVPEVPSTRQPGRVVALASKPIRIPGIEVHLTSNLWQDLSTASVFVYASDMEGLGSAALAAMAAGVPVVASRVGGLPEAIEDQRTGLLVENRHFEDAVRHLLQDPGRAAEMGQSGRERVQQKFTVEHMVTQTMHVYDEVLR
jgi:hypothetical protein